MSIIFELLQLCLLEMVLLIWKFRKCVAFIVGGLVAIHFFRENRSAVLKVMWWCVVVLVSLLSVICSIYGLKKGKNTARAVSLCLLAMGCVLPVLAYCFQAHRSAMWNVLMWSGIAVASVLSVAGGICTVKKYDNAPMVIRVAAYILLLIGLCLPVVLFVLLG